MAANIWAHVDPYLGRHMASLSHNELTGTFLARQYLFGHFESCHLVSGVREIIHSQKKLELII